MYTASSRLKLAAACDAKAAELLRGYQGQYTQAGVMLLVNEAVLAGADIGIDAVERELLVNNNAREIGK